MGNEKLTVTFTNIYGNEVSINVLNFNNASDHTEHMKSVIDYSDYDPKYAGDFREYVKKGGLCTYISQGKGDCVIVRASREEVDKQVQEPLRKSVELRAG